MASWAEFVVGAPHIAEIFQRRHTAASGLCMLGTLRADGSPRISPLEPRVFEDQLWILGMPNTRKFRDLARDPRFSLHTATVDAQVTEGDGKLWGTVRNVPDKALHERFAGWLYAETGLDLRGSEFDYFYAADLGGASSVQVGDGHLDITIWKPGEPERVVRKH